MPVKKEQFIPAIWFELKLTPKDQPVGFFTEVSGLGKEIESGKHSFSSLEKIMLEKGDAAPNKSGRQEMIENLINTYL